MRIESVSDLDGNGNQFILVFKKEPTVNKLGLWQGGECYSVDINWKKQESIIFSFFWNNGVPSGWKVIKKLSDEIIDKSEAIQRLQKILKENTK